MNRWKALATIAQAVIAFLLVTQSDIDLAPAVKVALGAISVGLAAVDWGAFADKSE